MGIAKVLLIKILAAVTVAAFMVGIVLFQGWVFSWAWNEAIGPVLNVSTKLTWLQGALFLAGLEVIRRPLFDSKSRSQARPRVTNISNAPREWPPATMQAKAAPGAGNPAVNFDEVLKRARANAAENARKRTGSSGNGA